MSTLSSSNCITWHESEGPGFKPETKSNIFAYFNTEMDQVVGTHPHARQWYIYLA